MNSNSWTVVCALMTCFILANPLVALADSVDGWCATYVSNYQPGLHKFIIRRDGHDVKIHAYASGFPDDIDWGESVAEVYPGKDGAGTTHFIAHFSTTNTKSMLVVSPNSGGGAPHSGGLVVGDLYMNYTDGRQPEYIGTNFQTPPDN